MRNPFVVFVLLFSLGLVFAGVPLVDSQTGGSMDVTEPIRRESRIAQPIEVVEELSQSVRYGGLWLAGLEMDRIFYAVLGVCGMLLAIRVILSVVRIGRTERLVSADRSGHRASTEAQTRSEPQVAKSRLSTRLASAQSAASLSASSPSAPPRFDAKRFFSMRAWARLAPFCHGLAGRMIFTSTAIIAAFGALTLGSVYIMLTYSLNNQWLQRASVAAADLEGSAPDYLFKKDSSRLRDFLRQFASQRRLAYVVVEDRNHKVFSHSFAELPESIQFTIANSPRSERRREIRVGDRVAFEVGAPLLEGQIGGVRVGLWKDEIDADIRNLLTPIIKSVLLAICGAILIAIYMAWKITRPILRLVRTAHRISEGELDIPSPGVNDAGEFGELSRSFERMRSSVKAVMVRLSQQDD